MSGVEPESELVHLAKQCRSDSERWFPKTSKSVPFICLALAGEVGELCNVVKKIERGSASMSDAKTRYDLQMEMADIFTYLLDLSGALNVDLVKLYKLKRVENEQRFGQGPKK